MSEKINVNFRADASKIAALDAIAKSQDRDRSYMLNQAVEEYIGHKQWLHEQVILSLVQAEAGNSISDEEFERIHNTWFLDDQLD